MENKNLRIAITHGDTNGTGYEMILKAFEDPTMLELCTPIIYGSSKAAAYHAKTLGLDAQFTYISDAQTAHESRLNLLDCFKGEEIEIELGHPTEASGQAALRALDCAIEDYKNGKIDAIVTMPVNRTTMKGFNGHTDYLERKLGEGAKGISLIVCEDMRVALVTNNLAIKDISESITRQKIVEKCRLFHEALRRDMRISNPRIAILSLNPRCGEKGLLGDEEQEVIIPAIAELEESGIQAFGPYAADTFFGKGDCYRFDGVLAMYHDQGLIPFKANYQNEGIRFSAGLSVVRTAPAIGAEFELAGSNKMEADSLRNAIYFAIDSLRNRADYDESHANPLPKLYHERRDESEKMRFRSPAPATQK